MVNSGVQWCQWCQWGAVVPGGDHCLLCAFVLSHDEDRLALPAQFWRCLWAMVFGYHCLLHIGRYQCLLASTIISIKPWSWLAPAAAEDMLHSKLWYQLQLASCSHFTSADTAGWSHRRAGFWTVTWNGISPSSCWTRMAR